MQHLERELERIFVERFRRIWVQRSKYSVCLTMFPLGIGSRYQIITLQNIYHGLSEETRLQDLINAINGI